MDKEPADKRRSRTPKEGEIYSNHFQLIGKRHDGPPGKQIDTVSWGVVDELAADMRGPWTQIDHLIEALDDFVTEEFLLNVRNAFADTSTIVWGFDLLNTLSGLIEEAVSMGVNDGIGELISNNIKDVKEVFQKIQSPINHLVDTIPALFPMLVKLMKDEDVQKCIVSLAGLVAPVLKRLPPLLQVLERIGERKMVLNLIASMARILTSIVSGMKKLVEGI